MRRLGEDAGDYISASLLDIPRSARQRFNRYPLIIDPSGQATEFIMKEFAGKKITKTSFLDDSFRKNLESALRFGNPLLVQVGGGAKLGGGLKVCYASTEVSRLVCFGNEMSGLVTETFGRFCVFVRVQFWRRACAAFYSRFCICMSCAIQSQHDK